MFNVFWKIFFIDTSHHRKYALLYYETEILREAGEHG